MRQRGSGSGSAGAQAGARPEWSARPYPAKPTGM